MRDMNDPREALSRRGLLRLGAGAAIACVAMSGEAHAGIDSLIVKKATKAKTDYKETASGLKCSGCWHFRAPNACRVVEGEINERGRCDLFVKKERSVSL
jgi:hypothetical protein